MARLAPAESWQIMKYMGIANSIKVEEAMQVQVRENYGPCCYVFIKPDVLFTGNFCSRSAV